MFELFIRFGDFEFIDKAPTMTYLKQLLRHRISVVITRNILAICLGVLIYRSNCPHYREPAVLFNSSIMWTSSFEVLYGSSGVRLLAQGYRYFICKENE
jgi:hypothetical protein